jgi:hypothetical protein
MTPLHGQRGTTMPDMPLAEQGGPHRSTLQELREAGLGHGGFDLGYGSVQAGDEIESGDRTGQVLEIFYDGDAWVIFDDEPNVTRTVKWRQIRAALPAPPADESGQ